MIKIRQKINTDKIFWGVTIGELMLGVLFSALYPEFWPHTDHPNSFFYQLHLWVLIFVIIYNPFAVLPILTFIDKKQNG